MIVSVLDFSLQPGAAEKLHEIFRRYRILETASTVEGCWKLTLSQQAGRDDSATVIGFWEDRDAYQRWLDHPERGAATEELLSVMSGDFDATAPAVLYEVLHAVPAPPSWAE